MRPDRDPVLIQMAARVSVPACEADPEGTHRLNVTSTLDTVGDFVAWARGMSLRPSVVYVSTGHVYAEHPTGHRITEDAPTAPRSVYATTKLRAEEGLRRSAEDLGFDIIIARVFGLIAPTQPANYLLPGLIGRVRDGRLAGIPGLTFVRDYLDARDVCEDLLSLAAQSGTSLQGPRVINVCSGRGVSIHDMLELIVRLVRPALAEELMAQASEAPGRPDDIAWIVGDPAAFVDLTGKQPQAIPLAQTVEDAWASV